ncbi:MAG: hypothetical protein E7261_05375 [Lachnospiraceae bacterium]|nr:hypothetical protein [Lachnospiraceae bacterium]
MDDKGTKRGVYRKKFANLYVKMTAKNHSLFLILILVSVIVLFGVTLTTKVDVVATHDAKFENNTIYIQDAGYDSLQKIYVYENRNEAVHKIKLEPEMVKKTGNSTEILVEDLDFIPQTEDIKVDIPVREITLFRRVFLQGGKNE